MRRTAGVVTAVGATTPRRRWPNCGGDGEVGRVPNATLGLLQQGKDRTVVTRAILRNWLFLGLALGAVGAVQVYGATNRLERALAMLGFGLAIGVVGGLSRLYYEWRQGGLGDEPKQWNVPTSRRLVSVIPLALVVGAGFARVAGARPAISIALTVLAAALALLLLVVQRDRADASKGGGR
jgi:hypothetical protein